MHLSRTAWRRCAAPGARQASSLRNTAVVNSRKKQEAPRLSLVGYVCARPASTLPDVCGLPVVTSSWKAIKSLDEAYTEVSDALIEEHTSSGGAFVLWSCISCPWAFFFRCQRVDHPMYPEPSCAGSRREHPRTLGKSYAAVSQQCDRGIVLLLADLVGNRVVVRACLARGMNTV